MKRKSAWVARRWQRYRFQTVLTALMTFLFSTVFLLFSLMVTDMGERILRQNVEDNMSIVVNQFDVYLQNYLGSIYDGFRSVESDQSLIQLRTISGEDSARPLRAARYVSLHKLITQLQEANATSVSNIYINFGDGQITSQVYDRDIMKIRFSYDEWKERFPESRYYWINADSCRDLVSDHNVGVLLFHLYSGEKATENGIILIALKQSFLDAILDSTELDPDSNVSLLMDSGNMHFGEAEAARQTEIHSAYLSGNATRRIRSEVLDATYHTFKRLTLTDWVLDYSVPESSIATTHFIARRVAPLTIVAIALSALLIALLSRRISYPLKTLTETVQAEDILEREIAVQSFSEITSLSNGLEEMRLRIKHLLGEVELEQETKRKIEIALLQEQINPHFLYNTLYSIVQLCEMGRSEQAGKMLEALSNFYRIGLSKGNTLVTVREELEHVRNYLYIQHFRYSDKFDYSIDCEEEILDCCLPKMSLQPLVENAIYHGVKAKRSFGNICILGGTHDGDTAFLEVHDDGEGFAPERLEDIRRQLSGGESNGKPSFGMKNVNTRMQYEFGEAYGLEIESGSGDTCVRIRFRMRVAESEGTV